jgi:hypothetical protein
MNTQIQDDADKLLHHMSKENSYPSKDFKGQLKVRVLDKYNKKFLFFSIFPMNKYKILGLFAAVLFVVIVVTAGGTYLLLKKNKPATSGPVFLTGAEKEEVLANVLRNNPEAALKPRSATASVNVQEDKQTGNSLYEYNFSYIRTKSTNGPKANTCPALGLLAETSSQQYTYTDKSVYYSKTIIYDTNGNLSDFYLTEGNESTEYRGGKYAVKSIMSAMSDGGMVTPETSQENVSTQDTTSSQETDNIGSINDFFGKDAQVEKVDENGKTYYIVIWTYESSCDISNSSITPVSSQERSGTSTIDTGKTVTIISKSWVDAETLLFERDETYLDTVADSNLLYKMESEVENSNKTEAEVQSIFTFPYAVPVKTNDYAHWVDPAIDQKIQKMKEYLKQTPLTLLFFQDPEIKLTLAYAPDPENELILEVNPSYIDYVNDRDFYPEGARGDKMYKEAITMYSDMPTDTAVSKFSSLFARTKDSLEVNIETYDSHYTFDEIYKALIINAGSKKGTVNLKIGQDTISTDLYQDVSSVYVSDSYVAGTKTCEGGEGYCKDSYSYIVIFEYKGSKYGIRFNGFEKESTIAPYLTFKVYDSQATTDRDFIVSEYGRTLKENAAEPDKPVSEN